ncbi:unnamed protein product [Cyclocybe aegerita]|uniref:Uncharacterized protein n=1 Tax=Cyclocybe aegerita TaxID=1973307 RepID=A0A8S0VZC2_CYCAE|nr:unnamed protein product [Cyclocybe aegerita]
MDGRRLTLRPVEAIRRLVSHSCASRSPSRLRTPTSSLDMLGGLQATLIQVRERPAKLRRFSPLMTTYHHASSPAYTLSEVPTQNGTTWSDTLLTKSCIAPISESQRGSTGI